MKNIIKFIWSFSIFAIFNVVFFIYFSIKKIIQRKKAKVERGTKC